MQAGSKLWPLTFIEGGGPWGQCIIITVHHNCSLELKCYKKKLAAAIRMIKMEVDGPEKKNALAPMLGLEWSRWDTDI